MHLNPVDPLKPPAPWATPPTQKNRFSFRSITGELSAADNRHYCATVVKVPLLLFAKRDSQLHHCPWRTIIEQLFHLRSSLDNFTRITAQQINRSSEQRNMADTGENDTTLEIPSCFRAG